MRTLLLLACLCISASAQNTAVQWTGANTNGTPEFWPIIVRQVGTNTALAGYIVLTSVQLDDVIRTNTPMFQEAQQTARAVIKAKADAFVSNLQADMDAAAVSVGLLQGTNLTNPQKAAELQTLKVTLGNVRTRVDKLITVSTQVLDQVIGQ